MILSVVVDQFGQFGAEDRLKPHPVLHVVLCEHEPIWSGWTAGADQVLIDANGPEIAEPDGEDREDGNGDSKLREHGSLDRRSSLKGIGFLPQPPRKPNH